MMYKTLTCPYLVREQNHSFFGCCFLDVSFYLLSVLRIEPFLIWIGDFVEHCIFNIQRFNIVYCRCIYFKFIHQFIVCALICKLWMLIVSPILLYTQSCMNNQRGKVASEGFLIFCSLMFSFILIIHIHSYHIISFQSNI